MSKVIWLGQKYTEIDGTAKPHSYVDESGQVNDVAAIRIKSKIDGAGIIIEGRPDEILSTAREILRTAELVVEQTMRDPELRRLYGIIGETAPDEEAEPDYVVGDPDPTPNDLPYCGKAHEGMTCTRRPHDRGVHIAGGGKYIVGLWYGITEPAQVGPESSAS